MHDPIVAFHLYTDTGMNYKLTTMYTYITGLYFPTA